MTAIALTIAGSDSSGGAGIQADLKTFAALGVYGASVLTALTAQNTQGVSAIHEAPDSFVRAEIDAVFQDLRIKAVKIGMIANPALIAAVADGLDAWRAENIVLDPVMVATSGAVLLPEEAEAALKDILMPRALLITPNLHEAARLLRASPAQDRAQMERQAEALLRLSPRGVLLKGGHGTQEEAADLLLTPEKRLWFTAPRHATRNTHGSGCTLSAAIAAGLAQGAALEEAIGTAKTYVTAAIGAADRLAIGHGPGPLHHFHAFWS